MSLTATEACMAHRRHQEDRALLGLLTNALQHLGYHHVTMKRAHWDDCAVVQVRIRPPVHAGPTQVLQLSHCISKAEREACRGQEEALVWRVVSAIQQHHKEAALAYAVQRNKDLRYEY